MTFEQLLEKEITKDEKSHHSNSPATSKPDFSPPTPENDDQLNMKVKSIDITCVDISQGSPIERSFFHNSTDGSMLSIIQKRPFLKKGEGKAIG